MHHVLELVPYQRVRPAVRVPGALPRERGHGAVREGVRLQQRHDRDVPERARQWQPSVGELWMTTPESREAVRHPRRRARARPGQRRTATSPASSIDVGAGPRRRTSKARTSRARSLLSSERPRRRSRRPQQQRRGRHHRLHGAARRTTIPIRSPDTRFAPPAGVTTPTFGWAVEPRVGASSRCSSGAARRSRSARSSRARGAEQGGSRPRRDPRRRQHDAGSRDRRPPVRGRTSSRAPTTTTPAAR